MFLKSLNPLRRIRELTQELRRTREERERARHRIEQLEREKAGLAQDYERLELLTDLLRSRQPKLLDILPGEDGAVAEFTAVDSVAARELVVETLPAGADIPLVPALLPPPGNPCLFSSA